MTTTTCHLHPDIQNAYKVLDGQPLTRQEALDLANHIHGEDLLDLISLANKVRHRFAAPAAPACSIINAKSGRCGQNCRFCAQSAHHHTGIDTYPLLPADKVLEAAKAAYSHGVRHFGYVTSGYGYTEPTPEFLAMLETFDLLHRELPDLHLCVSIGILSRQTAKMLAEHHVYRYNMNLQTSPAQYARLVADTHTIQDKLNTIAYLKEAGITNCTGGILGLGESWEDRIDMAFAIRDLDVEGSPLNILLPIPGTPLQDQPHVTPADAAKAFAIFRLVNPTKMLKFCAGRETLMKDFQALLMLSGLNSLMTGGYLTTRGRSVPEDQQLLHSLADF